MLLQRAGLPAIKVVDVVDIARAAGRVIMEVYKTDPEVDFLSSQPIYDLARGLVCRILPAYRGRSDWQSLFETKRFDKF